METLAIVKRKVLGRNETDPPPVRTGFNQHLVDRICEHLANGQSLEKSSPAYDTLCNYGIITEFAA